MAMKNDEIEIKELLVIVYKFFVKYKYFWLVTLIVAMAFAIYKYKTVKVYYSSEMIVTSNLTFEKSNDLYIADLQPIMSVLSILQTQVEKHNVNFLREIGLKNPKNIRDMKVEVFRDKNLFSIDPKNIKIAVDVNDASKLHEIQQTILNYCNNNRYVKNKFEVQKTVMRKTNQIVDKRIKFIDTIEYAAEKSFNFKNHDFFINFNDWNSIVSMETEKYKNKYLLGIESPVSIVQPFSKFPYTVNKKMVFSVLYFVVILILGLLVSLTIEFIKYLQNVKK